MWCLGGLKLVIPLDVFAKEEIVQCGVECWHLKQHPKCYFLMLQADTGLYVVATVYSVATADMWVGDSRMYSSEFRKRG